MTTRLREQAKRLLARATLIDPDTDLSRFEGRHVEVTQVEDGTRYAWRGVLTGLSHGEGAATCLMTVEEWASGAHAGERPVLLRYGNATAVLI